MRVLQFYPLAQRDDYGLLISRDRSFRAARFLTPEKAKAIALEEKDLAA